jgi:hypothetical protein
VCRFNSSKLMVSSFLLAQRVHLAPTRRLPIAFTFGSWPSRHCGTLRDGKINYVSVRQDALGIDCSIADMP